MTRTQAQNGANGSNGSFNAGGARIVKPLRGGGAGAESGPLVPTVANLQQQAQAESPTNSKRASWFSNQRAWPIGGASWT